MKKSPLFIAWMSILCAMLCSSCSGGEGMLSDEPSPVVPETPDAPAENDTIEVALSLGLDVKVEDLITTRAESAGDLIGINVYKGDIYDQNVKYAAAVFDDPSKMVFKLIKGQVYTFEAKYVPNAKAYVYNYPDGSFGMPFRNFSFDHKNQYLPNVVYYDDGQWSNGYIGPQMYGLPACSYQTTNNEDNGARQYLNLLSYYGQKKLTVGDQDTKIELPLDLCRIGITLNVKNFTEGKIKFKAFGQQQFEIEPGGNNHFELECTGYGRSRSSDTWLELKVFYDSTDGKTYLLGSTRIEYEYKKNYVFDFDLKDRTDGAVAISVPTDTTLDDEPRQLE